MTCWARTDARAEPARERQRSRVVVLDPVPEDRPAKRDPALAPELVPAVGDAVQVGVVGVVGAPGEVGPDDERGVRLRPVDSARHTNDDRGTKLVARRITGNHVVETGWRSDGDVERTACLPEGERFRVRAKAVLFELRGRLTVIGGDNERHRRCLVEARRRVDEGRQPLNPNDARFAQAAGAAPRRAPHARLRYPGPRHALRRHEPTRILVTDCY